MSLNSNLAVKMEPISTRPQQMSRPQSSPDLQIIAPSMISSEVADSWHLIRSSNPSLASPYFDLEFTRSVAEVRDDVEIAVFSSEGRIVALLPFQRSRPGQGVPVGGRLNDSHGILCHPDDKKHLPARELVEQIMATANLDSFKFHAMSQLDPSLRRCQFTELGSHHLDLSDGWDAYYQWARKNSVAIKRQKQKTRKMAREIGPIRFEFDCQSDEMLEQLIAMKRSKYQRSNTFDILSVEWASNLLRKIERINQPGFKGILSAIFAGDRLVAIHFGMLTQNILHYWFPVYDPEFHRYSPGTELLLEVARVANSHGITKVDLGYGDDPYKFRFCNGREVVSCGHITSSTLRFHLARNRYFLRQRLKGIPMKPLAKEMLRSVFPGYGQWNFR